MAGREVGQPDWNPEDIERALGAWLRLGTAEAASRETGIPGRTIRSWRVLHPERFAEHEERFGRELSALREEIAQQAAEGVQEAVLVARQALRGQAPIDGKGAAAILRALATVDTSLDRIARLDAGSPTAINEDRRSDGDLIREIQDALRDPELRRQFEAQGPEA